MSRIIFLTDKHVSDGTDFSLREAFGDNCDIITLELCNILEDFPLERLKALIYKYADIRAIACDVPLPVLEVMMISRQYLGIPVYTATYETDSQGFPILELSMDGEISLKISGFRELKQLLVGYGPQEHKRQLNRDIYADMNLVVHW